MVDVTQVDQVLINLATNARDAMPNGGVLSIEAGEAEYWTRNLSQFTDSENRGDTPCSSISDTGSGMDDRNGRITFSNLSSRPRTWEKGPVSVFPSFTVS